MKKLLLSVLFLISVYVGNAQVSNYWTGIRGSDISSEKVSIKEVPRTYKLYKIDIEKLNDAIAKRVSTARDEYFEIAFPDDSGKPVVYKVRKSATMHPDLQKKYPEITTFKGYRVGKSAQKVRFSLTKRGIHVLFSDGKQKFTYIDPYTRDGKNYIRYSRKDMNFSKYDLTCYFKPDSQSTSELRQVRKEVNDKILRTYRLAMACTGEYAQYHIDASGNTGLTDAEKKALVLAEMVTLIDRVNEIYENDLAISLQLIPDNDKLIFLDPNTDPYTNDDGSAMLTENQTTCDNLIGTANYDIGHVLSTGGGGVASLASVCTPGKARGVTGASNPVGDLFYFDFVAHEFGHQFGANHTFNGDTGNCGGGNRNDATAVEPGSGSTLMAYAGLCSPQNVQNHSDLYFHKVSMTEIWNNITTGSSTCAAQTQLTQNLNVPVANAGADYIIPRSTPFVLRGQGSDADNDPITYCWEQMDSGVTDVPPQATSTTGAVFRSYTPSVSADRYFPSMFTLLRGDISSEWEVLPSVARDLNFSLTVRDNNPEAGQAASDEMKVTVTDTAGPFEVTSQNTAGLSLEPNSTETITWNVANTDGGVVGVSQVNIYLSTDNGLTFDTLLKANTPNDGSEPVTVPANKASKCYVKVEAVNNIFFSINKTAFSIGQFNEVCYEAAATDVPVAIPDDDVNGAVSELNMTSNVTIESITVSVKITHTWVADLLLVLISPSGKEIELLGGACYGTNKEDIDAVFDDYGNVLQCSVGAPVIRDTIIPTVSLQNLKGDNSGGIWKLKVIDNGAQDIGTIDAWSINVCSSEEVLAVPGEQLEGFQVYPNPVENVLNVSFRTETSDKIRIDLFDLLGRKVFARRFNSETGTFKTQLNLTGIVPGMYILRVYQGDKYSGVKIILK